MEVRLLTQDQASIYKQQKGTTYETKYMYIGANRYDTEKKTITRITQGKNGTLLFHETACPVQVFSRSYSTELVRVTVYSDSPRIWKEELSPHEQYYFQQLKQPA
jgi:hypothetical protein